MVTVGAPIDGTVTGLSQLTVPGVVTAIAPPGGFPGRG